MWQLSSYNNFTWTTQTTKRPQKQITSDANYKYDAEKMEFFTDQQKISSNWLSVLSLSSSACSSDRTLSYLKRAAKLKVVWSASARLKLQQNLNIRIVHLQSAQASTQQPFRCVWCKRRRHSRRTRLPSPPQTQVENKDNEPTEPAKRNDELVSSSLHCQLNTGLSNVAPSCIASKSNNRNALHVWTRMPAAFQLPCCTRKKWIHCGAS